MAWALLSIFLVALTPIWGARGFPVPRSPLAILVGLGVAYAGLSLLWSPDPQEGLLRLYNLSVGAAVFLTLYSLDRKALEKWIPPIATVGLALLYLAWAVGILGNENMVAATVLLLIPLGWSGIWRFGAIFAVPILLENQSNLILVGLAAYLVAWRPWMLPAVLLGAISAVVLSHQLEASLDRRLDIWIATFQMWLDYPVFGVGLGGWEYVYPEYGAQKTFNTFVNAAHNDYLEIVTTFGFPGAYVAAIAVGLALIRRSAVLLTGAAMATVHFVTHDPATLLPLLVGGAMALPKPSLVRVPVLPALPAIFAVTIAMSARLIEAEIHWAKAWDGPVALIEVNRAYEWMPLKARYRRQILLSLMDTQFALVQVPPDAADAAYAISKSAGASYLPTLSARAMYLLNSERNPRELSALIARLRGKGYEETQKIVRVYDTRRP